MFPPAIIYINTDCGLVAQMTLNDQLEINEIIAKQEFDARIFVDPNYPDIIRLQNLRVLVLLESFDDIVNRSSADIIMFVKHGMATVMKNNCGPPGLTVPLQRIEIHQLLRYNSSQYTHNLVSPPPYPFPSTSLGGIFAIQSRDTSGVHAPNTDNEYNNEDFIHRK